MGQKCDDIQRTQRTQSQIQVKQYDNFQHAVETRKKHANSYDQTSLHFHNHLRRA